MTLTRSNVARWGLGRCFGTGLSARVGGGDRWAGEGRATAASTALGGRRVSSKACGVPDSVLLCARSLCPGCSHFTRARGPGHNLSRTLILHIPLQGGGRGRTRGTRSAFRCEGSHRGQKRGRSGLWQLSYPQTRQDVGNIGVVSEASPPRLRSSPAWGSLWMSLVPCN